MADYIVRRDPNYSYAWVEETVIHQKCVELQKMVVVGNAADDANLMNLAHEIIASADASYDQKIAALKKLDEAIGEPGEYSQAAIDQYLAETDGAEDHYRNR